MLGNRGRLAPHAAADLRAHSRGCMDMIGASHRQAQQPFVGQLLPGRLSSSRTHRPKLHHGDARCVAVAPDQDPLHRDRHRRGHERAGDQHERHRDDGRDEPEVGAEGAASDMISNASITSTIVFGTSSRSRSIAPRATSTAGRGAVAADRWHRGARALDAGVGDDVPAAGWGATASSRRAGCRRRAGSTRLDRARAEEAVIAGFDRLHRRPAVADRAHRGGRCHPCTG